MNGIRAELRRGAQLIWLLPFFIIYTILHLRTILDSGTLGTGHYHHKHSAPSWPSLHTVLCELQCPLPSNITPSAGHTSSFHDSLNQSISEAAFVWSSFWQQTPPLCLLRVGDVGCWILPQPSRDSCKQESKVATMESEPRSGFHLQIEQCLQFDWSGLNFPNPRNPQTVFVTWGRNTNSNIAENHSEYFPPARIKFGWVSFTSCETESVQQQASFFHIDIRFVNLSELDNICSSWYSFWWRAQDTR